MSKYFSSLVGIVLVSLLLLSCGDETTTTVSDADQTVDMNETVDEVADEMVDEMVDEVVDEAVDEAVDEIVDEMVDEAVDEVSDEDSDEVVAYDPRINPTLCDSEEYTWLKDATLGHILENESILQGQTTQLLLITAKTQLEDINLKRTPAHDVKVYRVRYQTQDRGKLVDATGLIAIPDKTGSFPIMTVLHGTAGFVDKCAPSEDTSLEGGGGIAALVASFGYIVIAPDYIGLKSMGAPSTKLHSYLIGEPTAIATLDMIRSVPNLLNIVGAKATAGDTLIMGGSQGGHAAAFTTRLAPYYAPEINIKGAIWGIPPTNLEAHMKNALNEMVNASGNTVYFLTSANEWYTETEANLTEVFVDPWDTNMYTWVKEECSLSDKLEETGTDTLEKIFTAKLLAEAPKGDDFMKDMAPWGCYMRENSLNYTSIPRLDTTPAFMILSEKDNLVLPHIERESMTDLCEQGYEIQFMECAEASHSKGFVWSLDNQMDWLDDRYQNKPMTDVCTLHDAVRCASTPDDVVTD
ncbi:hypothetical protein KAH37_08810 [bacterium]|nr:hypothetical protein [bacterium]